MSRTALFLVLSSALLAPLTCTEFSWQQPHATITPSGDLAWAPQPFVFTAGASVRYIDYEGGSDDQDGSAKERPWKHHPWDANASGRAKAATGSHTFVFKRGVTYRGRLLARDAGTGQEPLRLTSDPAWGQGEARLAGSEVVRGGWKSCGQGDAPARMPDAGKVWYRDVDLAKVECLWAVKDGAITRIPLARTPNWTVTDPDNQLEHWWTWTGSHKLGGKKTMVDGKEKHTDWTGVAQDAEHLTETEANAFDGGRVWSTYDGNMATPFSYDIGKSGKAKYHPDLHGFSGIKNPQLQFAVNKWLYTGARYFLENCPQFLDSPGEFWFQKKGENAGRVFLRLPGDADPNQAAIELAARDTILDLVNTHDVEVSGLTFCFNNPRWFQWPVVISRAAAVRVIGTVSDITVRNCRFEHLMSVAAGHPRLNDAMHDIYLKNLEPYPKRGPAGDTWDRVRFTDNDISDIDCSAMFFCHAYPGHHRQSPGQGDLGRLDILRNRFQRVGLRPYESMYSAIPAIGILANAPVEVAGNLIDSSGGSGVWIYSGKDESPREVPLLRTLVHHNKVTNCNLLANDYGGVESWFGGPTYIWSNISFNAIGPRYAIFHAAKTDPKKKPMYADWACNAYAFYLDHGYKNYVFNNVGLGKSNDNTRDIRNRAGGIMVHGFFNHWFNNSFHNLLNGITGSAGEHNFLLGNAFSNIRLKAFGQNAEGDLSLAGGGIANANEKTGKLASLGYAGNICHQVGSWGGPKTEITVDGAKTKDFETIRTTLEQQVKLVAAGFGSLTDQPIFRDPAAGDLRPAPGAATREAGVRFFVPWGLFATVGEWTFRRFNADPRHIPGEDYYMTEEYLSAKHFDEIPRFDLTAPAATADSYGWSDLDDWCPSVLRFDGKLRAELKHSELLKDYPVSTLLLDETETDNNGRVSHKKAEGKDLVFPGARRKTVDVGVSSFLIEAHVQATKGGVLVCKRDGSGYELALDAAGTPVFRISAGGAEFTLTGTRSLTDGAWHHLVAELDRGTGTATLYLDGTKHACVVWTIAPAATLANTGDFLVGGSAKGGDGFIGGLDFLRVARSTLAQSLTTIEELHAWQFDGPAQRDFSGRKPVGRRDAGAFEEVSP